MNRTQMVNVCDAVFLVQVHFYHYHKRLWSLH